MKGLTEQLQEQDDRADMTPMIDCVFLLLLFFIITATFSEESIFKVELPEAKTPELRKDTEILEILINKEGQYSIGTNPVEEENLLPTLRKIKDRYPIRALIIKADKQSPYEKAVRVVDIAQSLRITEFSLAVQIEN